MGIKSTKKATSSVMANMVKKVKLSFEEFESYQQDMKERGSL